MLMNRPYPVIDLKKTGENIKRLREARCISVVDLQYFLGLASPQAIYLWQRGVNLPTVDHLYALSRLFKVSMNDILVPQEAIDSGNANAPKVRRMQLSMATPAIAMVAM